MYKALTLEQTADFLESNTIIKSDDRGTLLVHTGVTGEGNQFVLVNSYGETSLLFIN